MPNLLERTFFKNIAVFHGLQIKNMLSLLKYFFFRKIGSFFAQDKPKLLMFTITTHFVHKSFFIFHACVSKTESFFYYLLPFDNWIHLH